MRKTASTVVLHYRIPIFSQTLLYSRLTLYHYIKEYLEPPSLQVRAHHDTRGVRNYIPSVMLLRRGTEAVK